MLSALPVCARRHAVWDVYQTPLMHCLAVLKGVSLGADWLWGCCLPMAFALPTIGTLRPPRFSMVADWGMIGGDHDCYIVA